MSEEGLYKIWYEFKVYQERRPEMEEKKELLSVFAESVRNVLGKNLKKIIVYGSYARGDNYENSDIDIMILTVLSDQENEIAADKIYDIAFDYEIDYGTVINPVLKNENQFNYWLGALPFYDNVKRDGIEIG